MIQVYDKVRAQHSRPKQRRTLQRPRTPAAPQPQARPTQPTRTRARPPPPTPSAPRRASSRRAGKAPSRSKQRRVAPGHTKWGSRVRGASVEGYPRTHSPRQGRHPHLPIAVNERAHLEFAEKECRERSRQRSGDRARWRSRQSSSRLEGCVSSASEADLSSAATP